jgi:hypothetical protein
MVATLVEGLMHGVNQGGGMQVRTRSLIGVALVACLAAHAAGAAAPPMQVKILPGMRPVPAVPAAPDRLQVLREAVEAGRLDLRDGTLVELARLDLRKGFVDGVASLEFHFPSNVSPQDNAVTFERLAGDFPSRTKLLFRAPAAGVYFFDFAVTGHSGPDAGERLLMLDNIGSPVQSRALKVGEQRAMYILEASAPGPMLMVLQSKSSNWTFRSVTISQLK